MQAGLNFLKCAFLCSGPPNAWFYDVLDMIGRKRPSTPKEKKKKKKKKKKKSLLHATYGIVSAKRDYHAKIGPGKPLFAAKFVPTPNHVWLPKVVRVAKSEFVLQETA